MVKAVVRPEAELTLYLRKHIDRAFGHRK